MSSRGDSQIDVAYHAKISQSTVSAFLRAKRGHEWLTLWGLENYLKQTRTKTQTNQDHDRRDSHLHKVA